MTAPANRSRPHRINLTRREREVLALLCDGLSNKLIARALGISVSTVKIHVSNIFGELGVSSRLQAVVCARQLGFTADNQSQGPTRPHQGVPDMGFAINPVPI